MSSCVTGATSFCIDIKEIIQTEFYQFAKREPKQMYNKDWDDVFTSYRFHRPAIITANKIVDFIKDAKFNSHLAFDLFYFTCLYEAHIELNKFYFYTIKDTITIIKMMKI